MGNSLVFLREGLFFMMMAFLHELVVAGLVVQGRVRHNVMLHPVSQLSASPCPIRCTGMPFASKRAAALSMGFGLSPREMARMSPMVRPDEPLEEELQGLVVLGAIVGLCCGKVVLGSSVLGALFGAQ